MVPIKQREIELKNDNKLSTMFFYALNSIGMGKFEEAKFSGDDLVAYKGYCREQVAQADVDKIIAKPTTKGMDYSNNIYRFIGVHLANSKDVEQPEPRSKGKANGERRITFDRTALLRRMRKEIYESLPSL